MNGVEVDAFLATSVQLQKKVNEVLLEKKRMYKRTNDLCEYRK
jgi:hypothetical protein